MRSKSSDWRIAKPLTGIAAAENRLAIFAINAHKLREKRETTGRGNQRWHIWAESKPSLAS
jgi:hypothetical protein